MLGQNFRPWGTASWLLPRLGVADWKVVGCISTEDRCNAILQHVSHGNGLEEAQFIDVEDFPSEMFSRQCIDLRAKNRAQFDKLARERGRVTDFQLMASPLLIKEFSVALTGGGVKNLLLDISSMPKRFFFPLIRLLLRSRQLENLVVSYTVPQKYSTEALAYEPQDWSYLPLFQREQAPPTPKCVRVIVSVGFLPFHLPELVSHDYEDAEIVLVLPFPPGSPQYQRNWQFIHDINATGARISDRLIHRVDATDVSGCFDHLSSAAQDSPAATILAPFGPKPHSLAMCLYAAKNDCDVYYTQPRYYHPNYSSGIKLGHDGKPATSCYAVRLGGRDLY